MVILHIKNYGDIKLKLYPEIAPNTCANFISLARSGFYNGKIFHRVIKGFMIQGGCPLGNGTGGPGYHIEGEFSNNNFPNSLSHKRGVISMARAMPYNSAGSQFFIMHKDGEFLDGDYASFGEVIEGIEIVDKIASVRTSYTDRPIVAVVIKSVEVIDEADVPVKKC